jgi:hypothetical protein
MRLGAIVELHAFSNFSEKKFHASLVSPSTIAKATGKIWLFPSWATTNNNVPLYFWYNQIPSTCTIGLQSEKPSMHGFKAQNKQWKNT